MDRGHDAQLVERVRSGDATAFAPLFERWYDRAYNVARGVVRRPELAADVTQDAFVAAWQQLDRLDDVSAFGGWLLRITRNRALDAIRREGRSTATDDETVIALHDRGLPSPVAATSTPGPAAVAELHEQEQLLWAASVALGERDASVLDLHLRHGLSPTELAEDLGVTPNHAHQLVHRLRQRLGDAIAAFLLWNRGAPRCADLAGGIGSSFDAEVARTVKRHIRGCAACREERDRRTDPTKLFAAVPFALAPLAFRARAAFALEQAGVPMPTELTAPLPRTDPTSTASDPDADTIRIDRGDPGGGPGPAPGSSGEPVLVAPSARRSGRRIAVAAAVVMVLVGCGALLLVNASPAPEGSTSAIAAATSEDPPTSTATSSATSTPETTTSTTTTTTTTTTTVPEPPTEPPVVVAPPPADPPADAPPPPPPPVAPPPTPAPRGPAVPPPPPPAPTPPSSTLPPRPPPPPPSPPTIQRLSIVGGTHACVTPTQPATARWITDAADTAELQWRGQSESVAVDGTRELCVEPGDQVVLVARNAGGEVSRTAAF